VTSAAAESEVPTAFHYFHYTGGDARFALHATRRGEGFPISIASALKVSSPGLELEGSVNHRRVNQLVVVQTRKVGFRNNKKKQERVELV
jgi:hypothetical protein